MTQKVVFVGVGVDCFEADASGNNSESHNSKRTIPFQCCLDKSETLRVMSEPLSKLQMSCFGKGNDFGQTIV